MKKAIKSTLVLVSICAVMAVLLALTNAITAPIIEKKADAAANKALEQVMPNGEDFKKVTFDANKLPKTVREVYKEKNGGYVIKLITAGYDGSDMTIMCGVNADGTVSGAVCLSSSETLGHEKTFGANFIGKNMDGVLAVETVSGATGTTGAYKLAVKDALNAVIILSGGTADLRTDEEIFLDNLSAALPAGERKFSKLCVYEIIEGIDAVYVADNNKGYVYVIGEEFFGVGEDGVSDNEIVSSAHEKLSASTVTDIDLSKFEDLPRNLISAKITSTGNYIIDTKGAGYGIKGGDAYHPASGEYIFVRVSMTPDGKIIDTLTVSQAESKNIGDACAKETFYGQFDGKTEADYENIDAISSATLTTNGYLNAIRDAFEAYKTIVKGAVADEK